MSRKHDKSNAIFQGEISTDKRDLLTVGKRAVRMCRWVSGYYNILVIYTFAFFIELRTICRC